MEVSEEIDDELIKIPISKVGIGFEIMLWEDDVPVLYHAVVKTGKF